MSATTVYKEANFDIPVETLGMCLKSSTALSIVWAATAKDKSKFVGVIRQELKETSKQLVELQATLGKLKGKSASLFFDFPDPDKPLDLAKLQPYTLLVNGDKRPILTVCLEGIDDPAAMVEADLIPFINEQFGLAGMDIDALYKRADEAKTFRSGLKGMLGPVGIMTMSFSNGEVAQFTLTEDLIQDEEWGSFTLSADEEPAAGTSDEPTPDGEDPKPDEVDELSEDEELLAASGEPTLPPGQYKIDDKKKKADALAQTTQKNQPVFKKIYPPANMREGELQKWINKRSDGKHPDAYAEYKQGKFYLLEPDSKPTGGTVLKDLKDLKSTTATAGPKGTPLPEQPVAPLPIPDIPSTAGEHIKTTWMKDRKITFVDVNGEGIHDPGFLKMDRRDDFPKSIGIPGISATYGWDANDVKTLMEASGGKMNPLDFATNWILHLTGELIKTQQKLQQRGTALDTADPKAAARAAKRAAKHNAAA